MLRRVALVRIDVSERRSALIMEAPRSLETSVRTRAIYRNIPENDILQIKPDQPVDIP
jgi:hypothetical protein